MPESIPVQPVFSSHRRPDRAWGLRWRSVIVGFRPLILRGVDRQIGLTERLAVAFDDQRHPSYVTHPMRDLVAQRIYQIACAYEDGNDANALRGDPVFKLALERRPLDRENDLASAPTISRLENAATTKDLYRMAQGYVDQFIASYATPPSIIVMDMDHSEDATHGQQEFSFYNHHYGSYCYLPLFLFEDSPGTSSPPPCAPANARRGRECHDHRARAQTLAGGLAADPHRAAR